MTDPSLGFTSFALSSRWIPRIRTPEENTPVEAAILVLVDRQGAASPLIEAPRSYTIPRFSPDGQRVAVSIQGEGGRDIWTYELARGMLTRVTFEGGAYGTWAPDGRQIAFALGAGANTFPILLQSPPTGLAKRPS